MLIRIACGGSAHVAITAPSSASGGPSGSGIPIRTSRMCVCHDSHAANIEPSYEMDEGSPTQTTGSAGTATASTSGVPETTGGGWLGSRGWTRNGRLTCHIRQLGMCHEGWTGVGGARS